MNSLTRQHRIIGRWLSCSLALAVAISLSAAELAPAQIFRLNDKGVRSDAGTFTNAFVDKETIDEIGFVLDDPKSTNRLTLKHGTYEVEYAPPDNVDYLRGRNADEAGDVAKAFETYNKAVQSARLSWIKEFSAFRAAQSAAVLKKYDDAIALVSKLEKDTPRSLWLDDALLVKGQAQAATGDTTGASKTFQTLTAMAREWGESAAIFGARGQASMATANKQYPEAITLLTGLIAKLSKTAAADDLAPVMLELAANQSAAGKDDDAIATLKSVAYRKINVNLQAQAHSAWAKILAGRDGTTNLTAAFDQAAIAGSFKGVDAALSTTNRQLLVSIVDKLTKDPKVSAADKADFKRALSSL